MSYIKQVRGAKKVGGHCCRGNAALKNTVDSPLFGASINKIPTTINAVLGVIVKNAFPIK